MLLLSGFGCAALALGFCHVSAGPKEDVVRQVFRSTPSMQVGKLRNGSRLRGVHAAGKLITMTTIMVAQRNGCSERHTQC